MQETQTDNRFRMAIVLFFVMLLGVSYVMKPLHMLITHHDLSFQSHVQVKKQLVSKPNHHDCSICSFEFCSYIKQESNYLPEVNQNFIQELIVGIPVEITYYKPTLLLLRAPPVA
jgi:hypothetical protein